MGVFCHSCLAYCLVLWSHLIYMNMREGKLASMLVGNPKISLNLILVMIMRIWDLSRTTLYCLYLFSLWENRNPVLSSSCGGYVKVVNGFTEHSHFYKCIICTNLFHPPSYPILSGWYYIVTGLHEETGTEKFLSLGSGRAGFPILVRDVKAPLSFFYIRSLMEDLGTSSKCLTSRSGTDIDPYRDLGISTDSSLKVRWLGIITNTMVSLPAGTYHVLTRLHVTKKQTVFTYFPYCSKHVKVVKFHYAN